MKEPGRILVIDLTPHCCDCTICGAETGSKMAIARYEDEIVPDNYTGEWGGSPVCERCFYLVRGYQEQHPGELVPFSAILDIINGSLPHVEGHCIRYSQRNGRAEHGHPHVPLRG